MKSPLLPLLVVAGMLFVSLAPGEAQAERLGAARSFSVQRPAAPAAEEIPSKPQAAAQSEQPLQGATAPDTASRWVGALTGLAGGSSLGWLIPHNGSLMAGALVGLLVGVLTFALLRLFTRPRGESRTFRYAEEGEPTPAPLPPQSPAPAVQPRPQIAVATPPIPANFDSASFIRQAKLNFIRLQEAHDRGDLNALREVTTESMFDSILADLRPHRAAQHTDLVSLDASLLEVTTEGEKHWASVRFHGTIREDEGKPVRFEEVWHLQKPVSGSSGWVLAGIHPVS